MCTYSHTEHKKGKAGIFVEHTSQTRESRVLYIKLIKDILSALFAFNVTFKSHLCCIDLGWLLSVTLMHALLAL